MSIFGQETEKTSSGALLSLCATGVLNQGIENKQTFLLSSKFDDDMQIRSLKHSDLVFPEYLVFTLNDTVNISSDDDINNVLKNIKYFNIEMSPIVYGNMVCGTSLPENNNIWSLPVSVLSVLNKPTYCKEDHTISLYLDFEKYSNNKFCVVAMMCTTMIYKLDVIDTTIFKEINLLSSNTFLESNVRRDLSVHPYNIIMQTYFKASNLHKCINNGTSILSYFMSKPITSEDVTINLNSFNNISKGLFIELNDVNRIDSIQVIINDHTRINYNKTMINLYTKIYNKNIMYVPFNHEISDPHLINNENLVGSVNMSRLDGKTLNLKIKNTDEKEINVNVYTLDKFILRPNGGIYTISVD